MLPSSPRASSIANASVKLQARLGIQPELVAQPGADVLVRLQRVGLPAGPVQRDHQPGPQRLAQRVGPDQLAQLVDHLVVTAGVEQQVDPPLASGQPFVAQPGRVVGL
jgi:hypothetical protein